MIRITQPVPETFIEKVLRLLASYDRKPVIKPPLPANLCVSVKNVEKRSQVVTA